MEQYLLYIFYIVQNGTSDIKRECLLKALAVYLGEDPTTLVTEYLVSTWLLVMYIECCIYCNEFLQISL